MDRVLSNELLIHVDSDVTLYGWVYVVRALGNRAFLILRDRGGQAQIVLSEELAKTVKNINNESIVMVRGRVKREERAPQGAEVVATAIEVMVEVKEETPIVISKKELNANLDTILDHRSVSLRHPRAIAIFRIQNAILEVFNEYFRSKGFVEIKTPETVGVATEGGTEVFEVKYFDKKAYLVQSPQLYKQIMVGVFERVIAITRVFRAELHNTSRHMNESTQLDIEMGFVKDHRDALSEATGFLQLLAKKLEDGYGEELKLLDATLPEIPKEIPALSLKEVTEILAREYGRTAEISDLSPEDERNISTFVKEKHDSDFVYITHYPDSEKPFYIYNDPENPEVTFGFDILFRGLEIASGGQRVHEYKTLLDKMTKRKMNLEHFEGYLEAFKYGMPPHAGWSIGLERLTMQLLGLNNVREASLFPQGSK